jgi:O-antigen ligase
MAQPVVTRTFVSAPALVILAAWGVLSFGAVYPWAYWPLFLGASAIGFAGVAGEKAWRDPRLVSLLAGLGVLALAIALQSVPLPAWLVLNLSPGADSFLRQFRVAYQPTDLRTLSLDPAATRVVLAEVVALALLLVGGARLLRRWNIARLVHQLMALALVVALIGIVQRALLDPDGMLIYGFWRPRQNGSPFGPFVNRNHFAGWMVMLLPVVLAYGWALILDAQRRGWQGTGGWARWVSGVEGNRVVLVGTSALIMALSLVMTGSRSGIVAATLAATLFVAFAWKEVAGRARLVLIATVLALLVGALAWAGAGAVVSRFGRAPQEISGRLSAWGDTLRIAGDFPLVGTGLGAYRQAMLLYQTRDLEALYAQAHNDYLQLIAEGGALVVVPAGAVLAMLLVAARRRLSEPEDDPVTFWVRRGAAAGLLGVAAQSVVEFSLQMPGNAVLCVILMALVIHRSRSYSHAYRV